MADGTFGHNTHMSDIVVMHMGPHANIHYVPAIANKRTNSLGLARPGHGGVRSTRMRNTAHEHKFGRAQHGRSRIAAAIHITPEPGPTGRCSYRSPGAAPRTPTHGHDHRRRGAKGEYRFLFSRIGIGVGINHFGPAIGIGQYLTLSHIGISQLHPIKLTGIRNFPKR